MIIVCMSGGLGNQIFQLSFAYTLQERFPGNVKLDISFFEQSDKLISKCYRLFRGVSSRKYYFYALKDFEIATEKEVAIVLYPGLIKRFFFQKMNKLLGGWISTGMLSRGRVYTESEFNDFIANKITSAYFRGYWQEYRFYIPYERLIRNKIKSLVHGFLLNTNHCHFERTCVIHIRKTDQASFLLRSIYAPVDLKYIENSIKNVIGINKNIVKLLICSDDIEWCKKNIQSVEGVEEICFSETSSHWEDFSIMLDSRFLIISNSTFSWWAGYLGDHKLVIAPAKWYARDKSSFEFIPESWIQV